MAAVFLSVVIGVPLGILSAARKNTWVDKIFFSYSCVGMSVPSFWLAPVLILVFGVWLEILPVSEKTGFSSIILPALSLSWGLSSVFVHMTRASFLEALNQD